MIRWLMFGLLLLMELLCDHVKNVVMAKTTGSKEITNVKLTTDEEDVYRLTCYTCVNVSDNKMCNEWAIDTPCPSAGRDFCRSLHILDSRGQSVLVSKSCASETECSPASVGCVPIDTQKVCISCCDTSYCNVDSPTNTTNATFSRKRRVRSKSIDTKSNEKNHENTKKPLRQLSMFLIGACLAFLCN